MDALHCATFFCTYPLNSIATSLVVTAVALARGGIYLRTAVAAYLCWIFVDPSPTRGGYELLWKHSVFQSCYHLSQKNGATLLQSSIILYIYICVCIWEHVLYRFTSLAWPLSESLAEVSMEYGDHKDAEELVVLAMGGAILSSSVLRRNQKTIENATLFLLECKSFQIQADSKKCGVALGMVEHAIWGDS